MKQKLLAIMASSIICLLLSVTPLSGQGAPPQPPVPPLTPSPVPIDILYRAFFRHVAALDEAAAAIEAKGKNSADVRDY